MVTKINLKKLLNVSVLRETSFWSHSTHALFCRHGLYLFILLSSIYRNYCKLVKSLILVLYQALSYCFLFQFSYVLYEFSSLCMPLSFLSKRSINIFHYTLTNKFCNNFREEKESPFLSYFEFPSFWKGGNWQFSVLKWEQG